jgi:lipoprotein-anchoring transpeptidase ErfK/SrfK
VRLASTNWSVHVDRSARRLTLRHGDRAVRSFPVAVGRPGTETPTGRFAITDRMVTRGAAQTYGCCILALSGRQPYLPAGWPGGDRLALHGSPGDGDVGRAASAGCLTAKAAVLQRLLKRLPVGTRVDIRA